MRFNKSILILVSATRPTSRHHTSYQTLANLLDKSSEEILDEMLQPRFQLQQVLNDRQMRDNNSWILKMTELLEKVTRYEGPRERIVTVLQQLPSTVYLEGVYDDIRKPNPLTDELRFDFIQLFLQISIKMLSIIPHSADDLTKIFERIELQLTKSKSTSPVSIFNSTIYLFDKSILYFRKQTKRKSYSMKSMIEQRISNIENMKKNDLCTIDSRMQQALRRPFKIALVHLRMIIVNYPSFPMSMKFFPNKKHTFGKTLWMVFMKALNIILT